MLAVQSVARTRVARLSQRPQRTLSGRLAAVRSSANGTKRTVASSELMSATDPERTWPVDSVALVSCNLPIDLRL